MLTSLLRIGSRRVLPHVAHVAVLLLADGHPHEARELLEGRQEIPGPLPAHEHLTVRVARLHPQPLGEVHVASRLALLDDGRDDDVVAHRELVLDPVRLLVLGGEPPHGPAHGLERVRRRLREVYQLLDNHLSNLQRPPGQIRGFRAHVPRRQRKLQRGHQRVGLRPSHQQLPVGEPTKVRVTPDHVREAERVPGDAAREQGGDDAAKAVAGAPVAEPVAHAGQQAGAGGVVPGANLRELEPRGDVLNPAPRVLARVRQGLVRLEVPRQKAGLAGVKLVPVDAVSRAKGLEPVHEPLNRGGVGDVQRHDGRRVPPLKESGLETVDDGVERVMEVVGLDEVPQRLALPVRVGVLLDERHYPQRNLEPHGVQLVNHALGVRELVRVEVQLAVAALPLVVDLHHRAGELVLENLTGKGERLSLVHILLVPRPRGPDRGSDDLARRRAAWFLQRLQARLRRVLHVVQREQPHAHGEPLALVFVIAVQALVNRPDNR
mmetsp:Transcript_11668/g.46971  ORF Transcript_11668/g.46971 Transcript_11668/m.46971 type:complete len:492 (+) Transcript_11668:1083-2558(+)